MSAFLSIAELNKSFYKQFDVFLRKVQDNSNQLIVFSGEKKINCVDVAFV